MAAYWLPIFFFTLIWGIVGGVLPWFVPNGPHKQLIQVHIFIGLKKKYRAFELVHPSQQEEKDPKLWKGAVVV